MAKIGLIIALTACVAGPLMVRIGLPYRAGLLLFALGVVCAAGLGLWVTRVSLVGLVGVVPLLLVAPMVLKALKLPPVADVMTRVTPPVVLIDAPQAENPLAITQAVTDAHNGAYSDVRPWQTTTDPSAAVLAFADQQGWVLVSHTGSDFQFESRSRLFGFVDDVVVRVSEDSGAYQINARSRSRVGVSDFGVNAARIRSLKAALTAD